MADRFLAAAVQLNSGADREANLAAAEVHVREAAAQGAKLVVLPELFNRFGTQAQLAQHAEPFDGPTAQALSAWAREERIVLCGGSIALCGSQPGRYTNTCFVFNSLGALVARYSKVHLFDIALESVSFAESRFCDPGEETVVVELEELRCRAGLAICYDLRFPELFRALSAAGCELLLIPSAFTLATGRDHWEVLVRARAIENLSFVVAANQFGRHTPEMTSYGRSQIVDPWGTVLATAADGPGLTLAEIDLSRLERLRKQMPSLTHRRSVLTHREGK